MPSRSSQSLHQFFEFQQHLASVLYSQFADYQQYSNYRVYKQGDDD